MLPINTIRTGTDNFAFIKYLFKSNNDIYSFSNNTFNKIGTIPATDDMFTAYGIGDCSSIKKSHLATLSNPILLAKCFDNTSKSANITSLVKPKLVLAKNDISLSNVTNKLQFTLTSNVSGGGVLKLIASTDSGTTWKTFDGTTWNTVDITNLSNVKTNGMTPTVFNAISNESWDDLIIKSGSLKVRFGYYLEIASTSDIVNTDLLTMTVTASGTWSLATLGTDYTASYTDSQTLGIKLIANGDYRITII